MKKIIKLAAATLTTAGAVTGGVATVVNTVQIINYEDHYEIVKTEKYLINGEEVPKDIYLSLTGFDVYYGAVDSTDEINLNDLTPVKLSGASEIFTCHINTGNVETEEGQYPVWVFPETYEIKAVKTSGFTLETEAYTLDGFTIVSLAIPCYDENWGGCDYTVEYEVK